MTIVVIGGNGLIGKKLVNDLRRQSQRVLAASRSTGVDAFTGKGLDQALTGAEVVVDVANAPSWEDAAVLQFFETVGRWRPSPQAVARQSPLEPTSPCLTTSRLWSARSNSDGVARTSSCTMH
ncbi:MAG TPA: hypothetical protein V6D22_01365 [Candidatus Obscuribacterales bacterium]